MADEKALFINHFHTHESNKFMAEVEGIWNYGNYNHSMEILGFLDFLPDDLDVVFNLTEHWKHSPEFFEKLEEEVVSLGGSFHTFDCHVCFELDGRNIVVINSVEASVNRSNKHFILSGLPIKEEEFFVDISFEELLDAAEDVAWTMPAHPFAPRYKISDSMLRDFFESAEKRGFETALGYTSGYTGLFNRMTHGYLRRIHDFVNGIIELNSEEFFGSFNPFKRDFESIRSLSDTYDVPVISEMDLHCAVPRKLDGAGLISSEAVGSFFDGEIPVREILESKIIDFDDVKGLTWKEFLNTFPGILPFYGHGLYKKFLPYEKKDFEEYRDRKLEDNVDVSYEKLLRAGKTFDEMRI